MIPVDTLREHILTAAEKYDLPLTVKQAGRLASHLAVPANRGIGLHKVQLTDVEFAALVGLASGEDAPTTARRICRSENTVKTHRRTLYRKLGARTGPQAVAIAIGLGLIHASMPETVSEVGA